METANLSATRATSAKYESVGRIATVTGSQSTVELAARIAGAEYPTVGKFMGITTGNTVIIGLITEVGEQLFAAAGGSATFRKVARLDLIGELLASDGGASRFQRGITEYPNINDSVFPNLRIFLLDVHNEYGRCFGDRSLVLNPRNLKLPFWLFNFEEIVDVLFAGRPGVPEELDILAEVIPMAKGLSIPSTRTPTGSD
jgi:hypothetical protein